MCTHPPVAKESVIASSNSPSCAAPCTRLSILELGFSILKPAHTMTHTTRSARSSSTTTCSKLCRAQ
ncbi:hypothetical protein JTE90_001390 [Oedothorax gibbosus]|uniref:Uncharacterized protein n=1 Tax=Oedothorax gibbosus TaxID=931172 RepID=A0AAV6VGZ4_9ARAC|nr:hypothetical protein JTE90_001390 [Oedothorax gibbosus]